MKGGDMDKIEVIVNAKQREALERVAKRVGCSVAEYLLAAALLWALRNERKGEP